MREETSYFCLLNFVDCLVSNKKIARNLGDKSRLTLESSVVIG